MTNGPGEAEMNRRMQAAVDAVVRSHAGSGDADGAVTALKGAMLAQGLTPQTGPAAEAELRRIADKIVTAQPG